LFRYCLYTRTTWRFVALDLFITIYYTPRMAHLCNRRGYFSLEESYRDEQGRPRKKRLAYFGKRKPVSIFDIGWHASLIGEPQGVDWWAIEQEEAARQVKEEASREDRLPPGLSLGPTDPTPVDKAVSEPAAPSEAPSESDANDEGKGEGEGEGEGGES